MLSLHQFLWKLCIFVYMAPLWKLIDSGVAYFHSMKISVISNSLLNVILMLHCMESCYCFAIDRKLRDTSSFLYRNNCDMIDNLFVQYGGCKCATISSIVSTSTGQIACVSDGDIDTSKNTWIVIHSVLFSLRKINSILSLLFYFILIQSTFPISCIIRTKTS